MIDRLDPHHRLGMAVDAKLVAVDDGDQALQLVMARCHCRFPDLPFRQLAVAQHAIDAEAALLHPPRQRHADCDGQAMAERTRGEVDSRNLLHVRMIAERTAEAREIVERACREIA